MGKKQFVEGRGGAIARVASVLAVVLTTLLAPAAIAAPPLPPPKPCPACWRPALRTSWQLQLQGPLDTSVDAEVYDIDGFDNSAETVAALHKKGRRVVCYISAGTWEDWRPDKDDFPKALLGNALGDWPGERWLDIRDVQRPNSSLAAIMRARLDMCRNEGFDAVDFDNVDAYTYPDSGFPLTAADQAYYNAWLANEAHDRGLSAVLKNDLMQTRVLLPYFDMALNEQCWQYNECLSANNEGKYGYDQWVRAGKAVFGVEYNGSPSEFCPKANAHNFNWLMKRLDLTAWRKACR